jgi:hypothetical protein
MSRSESPIVDRNTKRESRPAKALRDTKRPVHVYATADERAEIERRAEAANCSLSEYMRSAAMGCALRSRADADAVLALAESNAALERLQARVERLVSKAPGEATDDEVRAVLAAFSECERHFAVAADALA